MAQSLLCTLIMKHDTKSGSVFNYKTQRWVTGSQARTVLERNELASKLDCGLISQAEYKKALRTYFGG